MNLSQLADRVEALEGRPRNSSRDVESAKIDCEIWLASGALGDRKLLKFIRHRKPGLTEYGSWVARTNKGDVSIFSAPSYTASLDSAMSLVPPDCDWLVNSRQAFAHVWQSKETGRHGGWEARAAAPALALTAAALRARDVGNG